MMGYSGNHGVEQVRQLNERRNKRDAWRARLNKRRNAKVDESKVNSAKGTDQEKIDSQRIARQLDDMRKEGHRRLIRRLVLTSIVAVVLILVLSGGLDYLDQRLPTPETQYSSTHESQALDYSFIALRKAGLSNFQAGNYSESIVQLDQAVTLKPDYEPVRFDQTRAHIRYAIANASLQDIEGARDYLQAFIEDFPESNYIGTLRELEAELNQASHQLINVDN